MNIRQSNRNVFAWVLLTGLMFMVPSTIYCSGLMISTSQPGNKAINGYDTVAFFTMRKAVEGSNDIKYTWMGANWHFINEKNRNLFKANPEKYAPQYGGFCAWAMTEKRKARTDPRNWKIVNGKLYLNCSKSAMKKWERDIPGHIKIADKNWAQMNK